MITKLEIPITTFEISYAAQRVVVPVAAEGDDATELADALRNSLVEIRAAGNGWLSVFERTGETPCVVFFATQYATLGTTARETQVIIYFFGADGSQTPWTITIRQKPATRMCSLVRFADSDVGIATETWWYSPNGRDDKFAKSFLWSANTPVWLAWTDTNPAVHFWRGADGNIGGKPYDVFANAPVGASSILVWMTQNVSVRPDFVVSKTEEFGGEDAGILFVNAAGSAMTVTIGEDLVGDVPVVAHQMTVPAGGYAVLRASEYVGDDFAGILIEGGGATDYTLTAISRPRTNISVIKLYTETVDVDYDGDGDPDKIKIRTKSLTVYADSLPASHVAAKLGDCVPATVFFPAKNPEIGTFFQSLSAPITGTWFGQVGGGNSTISVFRDLPTPDFGTSAEWLALSSPAQSSAALLGRAEAADAVSAAPRIASLWFACALAPEEAAQISYAACWARQEGIKTHSLAASPDYVLCDVLNVEKKVGVSWIGCSWSVKSVPSWCSQTGYSAGGDADYYQTAQIGFTALTSAAPDAAPAEAVWLEGIYSDDGTLKIISCPVLVARYWDTAPNAVLPPAEILSGGNGVPLSAETTSHSVLWRASASSVSASSASPAVLLAEDSGLTTTLSAADSDGNSAAWITGATTESIGTERNSDGSVGATIYKTTFSLSANTADSARAAAVVATIEGTATLALPVMQTAAGEASSVSVRTGVITLRASDGTVCTVAVVQQASSTSPDIPGDDDGNNALAALALGDSGRIPLKRLKIGRYQVVGLYLGEQNLVIEENQE